MATKKWDTEHIRLLADMMDSGMKLEEVGRVYGITRERVRQLLGRIGYVNKRLWAKRNERPDKACLVCGDIYPLGKFREHVEAKGHPFNRAALIERDAETVRRYIAGERTRDIMEALSLPAPSILYRALRDAHVPLRRPELARRAYLDAAQKAEIIALAGKESSKSVGKRYGISGSRVGQIWKAAR